MDPNLPNNPDDDKTPSTINYILSFLLVGIAWGFTTPFIRRAAVDFSKRQEQSSSSTTATTTAAASTTNRSLNPSTSSSSWIKTKLITITWTVFNLLRTPAYAIPLLVNLSGSIWFFLLVGKHGMLCFFFFFSINNDKQIFSISGPSRHPSHPYLLDFLWVGGWRFYIYIYMNTHEYMYCTYFYIHMLICCPELSLTVPITNSLAFLFTVLGEWYVERKAIDRQTWLGMALVLGGIAVCVDTKRS